MNYSIAFNKKLFLCNLWKWTQICKTFLEDMLSVPSSVWNWAWHRWGNSTTDMKQQPSLSLLLFYGSISYPISNIQHLESRLVLGSQIYKDKNNIYFARILYVGAYNHQMLEHTIIVSLVVMLRICRIISILTSYIVDICSIRQHICSAIYC